MLVGVRPCAQIWSQHKLVGFWGSLRTPSGGVLPVPWTMESSPQPEAWKEDGNSRRAPMASCPVWPGGSRTESAARVGKLLSPCCCGGCMAGAAWGHHGSGDRIAKQHLLVEGACQPRDAFPLSHFVMGVCLTWGCFWGGMLPRHPPSFGGAGSPLVSAPHELCPPFRRTLKT